MTTRVFILVIMTLFIFGIAIGFLWLWSGLPTGTAYRPGEVTLEVFPSIYAVWIPLIYLFFTSLWSYLLSKQSDESFRFFLRLDSYTYVAVLIFFLLQILWKHLGLSALWFRSFVFALIVLKGFLLFRAIYKFPQLIHAALLVVLSSGIYLLLFPFAYMPFAASVTDLFQRAMLMQIGSMVIKSIGLSFMMLEMFRLSIEMTKSVPSALFSWVIVSFTFPVIGFPSITYILVGLLIIFILRLVFSRLDTKELMIGLLTPTNLKILIKFLVVLMVLSAAGLVFWSNVKTGFGGVQGRRALQAAISTLFDGQLGLFCYAPGYWLAFCGLLYLLFFKVWDGLLLIVVGGVLYVGYYLAVYGMLGRVIEQNNIVPFLPILGVLIAVTHDRFGKMALFQCGIRCLIVLTGGITSLLVVLYPHFNLISSKIGEIQRNIMDSLGKDMTYLVPSTVFHPYSLSLFVWLAVITVIALFCCNVRTRSFYPIVKKTKAFVNQRLHIQEVVFSPFLLFLVIFTGALIVHYGATMYPLPIDQPILLSRLHDQKELIIAEEPLSSFDSKGILIVSNLTASGAVPHKRTIANVIVFTQDQHFETFSLKAGQDTSEIALEKREVKALMAHGRAAIYRSWSVKAEDNTSFEAHEYYTRFLFSKPMNVQRIIFKFLEPHQENLFPDMALHIQKIALIN